MKKSSRILIWTISWLSITWSIPSPAQAYDHGWYLGAGLGQVVVNHDIDDFDDGSIVNGRIDDEDSGWKIYGVYGFNKNFAIESGFADLNNDVDSVTSFAGTSDGSGNEYTAGAVSVDIDEPRSLYIAAVGLYPLNESLILFGKAGMFVWRAEVTTIDASGKSIDKRDDIDVMAGFGVRVRLTDYFSISGEIERFADIAGYDYDLTTLSLVYEIR